MPVSSLCMCTTTSLTLHTLTSVCTFSILFSIHFPRCWQGEFVSQSRASLVSDHCLYSLNLNVWFRGETVRRNYMLVTLGVMGLYKFMNFLFLIFGFLFYLFRLWSRWLASLDLTLTLTFVKGISIPFYYL